MSSNVRSALVPRQSTGSATSSSKNDASITTLLSTLIPLLPIAGIYITVFLVFRAKVVRIYQPRTYLGRLKSHERTPTTSATMFGWIKQFISLPDTYVLNHQTIDAYLFLRFIKILLLISGFGTLLCWPILMSVDGTASGGQVGFNKISYSNIDATQQPNRYYAHVLVLWVFLGFVLYVLGRETMHYLSLRQAYQLSPYFASRISTRTVCFTDVPEEFLDEQKLRLTFHGVKHVWIATDVKELEELVKERDTAATKLEGAETALATKAMKKRAKAVKKAKGGEVSGVDSAETWLTDKERPTHKLKFLIGKKVDTIDWCRTQLAEKVPKVEQEQEAHWNGKAKYISACFIEFETVAFAQNAFQAQVSRQPKRFQPRAIGVAPSEIIWKNLGKHFFFRDIARMIVNAIVVVVIIFWGAIIGFGGLLTNIQMIPSISPAFAWLSFINAIPSVILGVVTGLLPTIYVSVLMALVPIFLRLFARVQGAVSLGEVELWVQSRYYAFQVVDVFLITTLSSSLVSVAQAVVADPSSAPALLAQSIPKASNFYISYFVVQAIGFAGGALANVVAFALFIILGKLLDKTPRKMFNRYMTIAGMGWGTTYPMLTLLGTICLIYSNVAPLVLGFGFVGFLLFYVAYRYNLFYTVDTTTITAYGANYAKALNHLMIGVYISEVMMTALMAIATGSGNGQCAGPLALMIIFLLFTIWAHSYFNGMVKKLKETLPLDLVAASQRQNTGASHVQTNGTDSAALTDGKQVGVSSHANGKDTEAAPFSHAKPKSFGERVMIYLFHPQTIPELAPHFYEPIGDYSPEVRREAYLNPAITTPTPFLWIPRDPLGISKREIAETGKVVGISDDAAWYDESGKIQTSWLGQEKKGERDLEQQAPIYEKPIDY